jgi:hypothetical protein
MPATLTDQACCKYEVRWESSSPVAGGAKRLADVASGEVTNVNVSWPEIAGTAAAIVAIGGGVIGVYRTTTRAYARTFGSRRLLAVRLNQLAAGVTIRYVEERLGAPAFVRTMPLPSGQTADQSGRTLREQVYHTRHAWVQVLTDQDAVVRFSITVTDPRFHFQVQDLTFGHLEARLGRTRFSGIRTVYQPEGRSLNIAARRYEYSESYWFGNPGNFQRYVLSHNDAGSGHFGFSILQHGPGWCQEGSLRFDEPPAVIPPAFDSDADYARQFRGETTVNTLTILGPARPLAELAQPRGPDADYVRVLVPGARERRKMRRLIEKMNRRTEREIRRQPTSDTS